MKEVAEIILSATCQCKFYVDFIGTKDIIDFAKWWPTEYKETTISEESKVQQKTKREYFSVSSYHQ